MGAWFISDENVINEASTEDGGAERRINNERGGTKMVDSGGGEELGGYCFSNEIAARHRRRSDHDVLTLCSVALDVDDVTAKSGNNSDEMRNKTGGDGGSGGYVADTELEYPRHNGGATKEDGVKFTKSISQTKIQKAGSFEDTTDPTDSPRHHPFPLPLAGNCLGLHRILQGCVIRNVLRLTYAHVSGSFTICIIQVYAMFGVYGVLSNERVALPWPWYTFQTFAR